jgi:Xaa-Pro aminopeptidase
MPYTFRIKKLQEILRRKKSDAILISQPQNRRYLSGYTAADHGIEETSGLLLVPRHGAPYLLTDFRFRQQAETEVSDWNIMLYPGGMIALLKKLLPDLGIRSLAFETDYTLHSTALKLIALGGKCNITMTPVTGLVEKMRLIKSKDEIDLIRRSVQLNESVFRKVYKRLSTGLTEVELALEIAGEMRKAGAEGESFDTIAATGAASALPHAVPRQHRLEKDSPLVIDMGLILDGYCSDMTRTICLGTPDSKYKEIHRIVRRAQLAGINTVKAGVTGQQVDKAARRIITEAGYGKFFGHALGHGVGMAVHEEPRVSSKSRRKLRAGMVITIEPGIYIPGWGGIRLENMVVVQEDGCENLNKDTTWLDI